MTGASVDVAEVSLTGSSIGVVGNSTTGDSVSSSMGTTSQRRPGGHVRVDVASAPSLGTSPVGSSWGASVMVTISGSGVVTAPRLNKEC